MKIIANTVVKKESFWRYLSVYAAFRYAVLKILLFFLNFSSTIKKFLFVFLHIHDLLRWIIFKCSTNRLRNYFTCFHLTTMSSRYLNHTCDICVVVNNACLLCCHIIKFDINWLTNKFVRLNSKRRCIWVRIELTIRLTDAVSGVRYHCSFSSYLGLLLSSFINSRLIAVAKRTTVMANP